MKINISRQLFNNAYYPYLTDYTHRTECYYGGAGSGKSHFVASKLIIKALKSKRLVLVIRKVAATQKDSCWALILSILAQYKLLNYCTVNKSDYTITLPNGSTFLFKGLDNPEKIKSIAGITDVWIEEATELTLDDYTQLQLRLRAKAPNLQMFLSYNPVSKANWIYRQFHAAEATVPEDTLIIKTTYKDNRFLPQDYVAALERMQQTNPTYYRIYALGEFCSLDKLIYNNWQVQEFDYTALLKQQKLITSNGLDFGFVNDATAFVSCLINEETKTIYIYDEIYQKGLTNDKIAELITYKGHAKSLIIADSAEQKSIAELKKAGLIRIRPAVKGADSVIHGIQQLQQYQLMVHPRCQNTITELQNYSWQKDKQTNEYINKPIDDYNHCLDALRYSLQAVTTAPKLQTMSKALLGL